MLKKFFQAFRPTDPPALPDPDAELALGALLVRDHNEHEGEVRIIEEAYKAMGLSFADNEAARSKAMAKIAAKREREE